MPEELPQFGFLAMPYSQSHGLFMNCLLYHEAGHFIAEETNIISAAAIMTSPEITETFKGEEDWAAKVIVGWMEELYADLIAVKLIGPAYTLAYLALLQLYPEAERNANKFYPTHPADAFRLKEQLKVLETDGWEDHVPKNLWEEIKTASNINSQKYLIHLKYPDPDMEKLYLFLIDFCSKEERIQKIHELANKVTDGRENPQELFSVSNSGESIKKCFSHGIVPSVITNGAKSSPHPVAIINGSMFFWLSGMEELFSKIQDSNGKKLEKCIENRIKLEQRVESWAIKAIEDWFICADRDNKGNKKGQPEESLKEPIHAGVLTKPQILKRSQYPIENPQSLVITPFPYDLDRDSVDLRLGSYFFIPRGHKEPYFLPGISNPLHLYTEQYVPLGSYLVVPAHHSVLGVTLEYIKLPSDVSGEILTKSSWARTFITIETAPWIHPSYRGCLTLEIANVSNTPIVLYPGMAIAQMILLMTDSDTAQGEDILEGTYIGPVRPEPAQLPKLKNALHKVGILPEEIIYPIDEYFSQEEFCKHVKDMLKKMEKK